MLIVRWPACSFNDLLKSPSGGITDGWRCGKVRLPSVKGFLTDDQDVKINK
ncbi:hypothetical protein [Gracilibacillus sp. JCM 18860]|uniref:hypothetical protein n=1 Tax=Gracilibacillus sp. JCM 18860 TaxID=1306159 RepID=UPI0032615B62